MQAVLVHGMGRTALSMLPLAARLRSSGLRPKLFTYFPTFETFEHCSARLAEYINRQAQRAPVVVIGHSLGTVLLRSACSRLRTPPRASFFLAPPTKACRAAKFFAPRLFYRATMGEMGQLLADARFMDALPIPRGLVRIYAGTAGPVGRWSPFGVEPNDGILAVHETVLPGIVPVRVSKLHSFIMNSAEIAADISEICRRLENDNRGEL